MTLSDQLHHLSVEGRIDALHAPELDEQLRALHQAGARTIVLDLEKLSYMSSSGLRVLLLAHRRQQERDGQVILTNTPPRVLRVLRMAGFDQVFVLRDSSPKEDKA